MLDWVRTRSSSSTTTRSSTEESQYFLLTICWFPLDGMVTQSSRYVGLAMNCQLLILRISQQAGEKSGKMKLYKRRKMKAWQGRRKYTAVRQLSWWPRDAVRLLLWASHLIFPLPQQASTPPRAVLPWKRRGNKRGFLSRRCRRRLTTRTSIYNNIYRRWERFYK